MAFTKGLLSNIHLVVLLVSVVLVVSSVKTKNVLPKQPLPSTPIDVHVHDSKQGLRALQTEVGKRSSITFLRFRNSFGHFAVMFFSCFCHLFRRFFAKLLLPDSFCGRVTCYSLQPTGVIWAIRA